MLQIKRREFITQTGGVVALPLAARAQQPASPRLGVLLYSNPKADPQLPAVLRGLSDLGYTEGRNINVTYRYAEGSAERLPDLASELAQLKPDVILAIGGDVAPIAKKATQSIPIVFLSSADPQQLGLVESLARPGGNATGVTLVQDELASKRLELLKEAAPGISEVAFIWNPDHPDNEQREAQRAAQALGVRLHLIAVRGTSDFDGGFQAAVGKRADSLYVVSSRLTFLNMPRIVAFATRERIPLAGGWGSWAKQGALLSYGPDLSTMAHRSATYIDKILKGRNAAELPVEQPTRFDLVINLKTAKALGLTLPQTLVSRADEVIE
jgi:putative ABC transport system substrate-binding protein